MIALGVTIWLVAQVVPKPCEAHDSTKQELPTAARQDDADYPREQEFAQEINALHVPALVRVQPREHLHHPAAAWLARVVHPAHEEPQNEG